MCWRVVLQLLCVFCVNLIDVAGEELVYEAVPPSPGAREFVERGDFPVSFYTGIPEISIPLYTIELKDISIPISISYDASGIKVAEEASRVGLGWRLDAGGVVTQTVNGRHQDFQDWSYMNYLDEANPLQDLTGIYHFDGYLLCGAWTNLPFTLPSGMTHENLYRALTSDDYNRCGSTDLSPDLFRYSIPGYSGRFIFSHSGEIIKEAFDNVRIEPVKSVAASGMESIAGWRIVTGDGTKYHFARTEKTTFIDRPSGESFNSAIYLSKIETVSGSVIEFGYTKDVSYLASFQRNNGTGAVPVSRNYAYYETTRLSDIRFPGGRVEFVYAGRTDLPVEKALSRINVYDEFGSMLYHWQFDYGYFQANFNGVDLPTVSDLKYYLEQNEYYDSSYSTLHYTDEWNETRLRLDAVSRVCDGEADFKHRFFYNEKCLPTKLSSAQDHWGYFNGTQNKTLIPRYYINRSESAEASEVDIVACGRDADRNPNPDYGKAFMLDSIVYPTGGATKLTFEANRYKTDDLEYDPTRIRYLCEQRCDVAYVHFGESNAGDDWMKELNFSIANGTNFTVIDICQKIELSSSYTNQSAELLTQIINTATNQTLWTKRFDPINHTPDSLRHYHTTDTLLIRPGDYKLVASGALHKYIQSAELSVISDVYPSAFLAANPSSVGGGQRIAEMRYYDSDGEQKGCKAFLYTSDGSTTQSNSSGRLMEYPRYRMYGQEYRENGLRGSGYSVGYSVVTVMEYDRGDEIVGRSVYEYVNKPNKYIEYSWKSDYQSETDQNPLGVGILEHSENGSLLRESHYKFDYGFSLVREAEYEYAAIGDGPYIVWGVAKNPQSATGLIIDPCYDEETMRALYEAYGAEAYDYLYNPAPSGYLYPALRPYWYVLTKKTVNQDGVTTVYDYKYSDYTLCEKSVSSLSRTFQTVKYRYAKDLLSSSADSAVMARMIADNRVEMPVEIEHIEDSTSRIERHRYRLIDGVPRISTISTNTTESRGMETRLQLANYDKYGNVAHCFNVTPMRKSYIWSYGGQLPIAKIEGVTYTKVKSVIDTATINRIADAAYPSAEQLATVNALREALPEAMVTTYTYKPQAGITSITDPAGVVTGFEYDKRGNLRRKYFVDTTSGTAVERTLETYDIACQKDSCNYTLHRIHTDESGMAYLDCVAYYDGLGRKEQTVEKGITPSGADLVSLTEYGSLNRKCHLWLPAVMADNGGVRVDKETLRRASLTTNFGDGHPYSVIGYEASPLGRVIFRMGEGMVWHAADKAVGIRWGTNSMSVDSLKCIRFKCNLNYTSFALEKCGFYDAGELSVTRVEDEDRQTVFTFKNPIGRTILERRMCDGEPADTYYVYDSYGRLSLVIPPMASREMAQMTESRINSSHAAIDDYCYAYYYDKRHRCIGRKLPGADWIYRVYDNADRLTFSQTGNQRQEGVWAFSIYDRLGRLALAGECHNAISVFARQSNTVYATRSDTDNALKGYNVGNFTPENPRIFMVNYYDDHDFMGRNGVPDSASRYGCEALSGFDARYRNAKGVQTGSLTAVLDDADTLTYLPTVVYRDIRGREVQTTEGNRLGGIDKRFSAYNFVGQPTILRHEHSTGMESHTDIYRHGYDHAGRLTYLSLQHDNGSLTTLQTNTYDEFGRLIRQTLNDGATSIDYTYNIHGWLKTIESPNFSQSLYYELKPDYSTGCYNGNISANHISLISENETTETTQTFEYAYKYDSLNRLTEASITGSIGSSVPIAITSLPPMGPSMDIPKYSTGYSYDYNGNLLNLVRYGRTGISSYVMADSLMYSYTGNQIKSISDLSNHISSSTQTLFDDLADEEVEYTWDANGNMTSDLNKGITSIEYNHLHLPRRVEFADGHISEYLYDATGRKLQSKYLVDNRVVFAASISGETEEAEEMSDSDAKEYETLFVRDYCDKYIYKNNESERLLTPNGFYTDSLGYVYFIQDYQGNVVNLYPNVSTSYWALYYPYGTPILSLNEINPYLYSAKEFDGMNGHYRYDFHARWHDPQLGRFTTPDPLCEKYYAISPYSFCAGNPVNFTDPTGMDVAVLLNTENIVGHIALLVQNENNEWRYYSVNGDDKFISGEHQGAKTYDDIDVPIVGDPQSFLNNDGGGDVYNYEKAFIIPTTPEQDIKIAETFKNESEKEYNLLGANCATAVANSLINAGINVNSYKFKTLYSLLKPIVPKLLYNEIIQIRSGYEIKKH